MADMVLIHNTGKHVYTLPGERPGTIGISIPPGGKEVPKEVWEKAMEHQRVIALVDEEILVVASGSGLTGLSTKKAVAIVKDTWDQKQLEEWAKSSRKPIAEAAREQLAELKKKQEAAKEQDKK